jgi:hypothetical protein
MSVLLNYYCDGYNNGLFKVSERDNAALYYKLKPYLIEMRNFTNLETQSKYRYECCLTGYIIGKEGSNYIQINFTPETKEKIENLVRDCIYDVTIRFKQTSRYGLNSVYCDVLDVKLVKDLEPFLFFDWKPFSL